MHILMHISDDFPGMNLLASTALQQRLANRRNCGWSPFLMMLRLYEQEESALHITAVL